MNLILNILTLKQKTEILMNIIIMKKQKLKM